MFYTDVMKKYKFRFTTLILILLWVTIVLCVAAFGWNIYRFTQTGANSVYEWIQYGILFFTSVFFAALIVSILIRSQYILTEKQLITQFGFIRSKYEIANITSVHLFKGAGKLAVYFNDNKYMVIVVKPEWNNEFIKDLLSKNEKIRYDVSTTDKDGDDFVE